MSIPHDDDDSFSRALIGGKSDDEIRARVPFELRQKVQELAHGFGMTESQFVRDLLTVRVYGLDHYQRVLAAHAFAVAGASPVGGTNAAQPTGGAS